jgi:hypothetical protein
MGFWSYFEDWWNGGQGYPRGHRPGQDGVWDQLATYRDAYGQLVANKRFTYPTQITLGENWGKLKLTDPQTSVLGVGAPRRGKTAGFLIPAVFLAPGPCLATSTKPDIAIATAMCRRRTGDVWHFSPTEPCPVGFKELKWSPVVGADDYDRALIMARRLVKASAMEAQSATSEANHRFFTEEAALAIAALLHYAAVQDLDIEFVIDALRSRSMTEMKRHVATLDSRGSRQAARDLAGLVNTSDRQRDGVFATAAVSLRAYEHSGALKAAKEPNFDPDAFVAGLPDELSLLYGEPSDITEQQLFGMGDQYRRWIRGAYDTVYITTGDAEDMTSPLIITLVGEIRRAAYAQARKDDLAGYFGRAPTTLVLDELFANPLPDLPQIIAEGASRGCVLIGGLQAPAQAIARWGEAGKSFLTVWQNLVVFSGLRDPDIQLLSSIAGEHDREMWGGSEGYDPWRRQVWNRSKSWDRMRNLPPDVIARGDPDDPDNVLTFTPNGDYEWIRMMPYYRGRLWPSIIVQSCEWALRQGLYLQPLPDLNRTGDYRHLYDHGGQSLVDRWKQVESTHRRMRDEQQNSGPGQPNAA